MDEGDADRRAEMPEDSRKVAGGTREKKERGRQASTAVKEETQPGAMMYMSLLIEHQRFVIFSRTAVCRTARTVV
jgi:hypothetical protein